MTNPDQLKDALRKFKISEQKPASGGFSSGAGTEAVAHYLKLVEEDANLAKVDFERNLTKSVFEYEYDTRLQRFVIDIASRSPLAGKERNEAYRDEKNLSPMAPPDLAIAASAEMWVREANGSDIDSRAMTFPNQITEAVADFYGTEIALDRILNEITDEHLRKQALLDVLSSLPPLLFDEPSGREVMDQVGSKKTNETRALRILLTNPKVQSILGCSFDGEAPRYCGR